MRYGATVPFASAPESETEICNEEIAHHPESRVDRFMAKRYFITIYNGRQERVWGLAGQALAELQTRDATARWKEFMFHVQCIRSNKTVAFGYKSIVSTRQILWVSASVLCRKKDPIIIA